jgi:hypothetical protein
MIEYYMHLILRISKYNHSCQCNLNHPYTLPNTDPARGETRDRID